MRYFHRRDALDDGTDHGADDGSGRVDSDGGEMAPGDPDGDGF